MVKKIVQKPQCVDYHDTLIERLKDHDYAVEYLTRKAEILGACSRAG